MKTNSVGRLEAWIVTDNLSSTRCLNASRQLSVLDVEPEIVTVPWMDPELSRLQAAGASPPDIAPDHGRVALAISLAHQRAWSRLSEHPQLTDSDWGLFVEDDITLHPDASDIGVAALLGEFFRHASAEGFAYLGMSAPTELGARGTMATEVTLETGRGAGFCSHAYAVQKWRARVLSAEIARQSRQQDIAFPVPLDVHLRRFWLNNGGAPMAAINLKSPDRRYPAHRGLFYQDRFVFPSRFAFRSPGQKDSELWDTTHLAHVPLATVPGFRLSESNDVPRLESKASSKIIRLSGSAALVWSLCEQGASQVEMVEFLNTEFPGTPDIADDVAVVLGRFRNLELIRFPGNAEGERERARCDAYLSTKPGIRLGTNRNGYVLRDLHQRRRWPLDGDAARVWKLCERPRKPAEIVSALRDRQLQVSDPSSQTVERLVDMGVLDQQPAPGTVRVKYLGRLGNHFFIHCFGRILAQQMGIDCWVAPLQGFPYTSTGFAETVSPDRKVELVLTEQTVDARELGRRDPAPRRIFLAGYFQRYEYYKPYKEAIRNDWLRFERIEDIDPNAMVVHVRGGDVWQRHTNWERGFQTTLPVSYYRNILDRTQYSRLYIVTERTDDPIVQRLCDLYRCEIVSKDPLHDFRFVASAHRIIMSKSTFAWWAAWLSDAGEIHFPREESWAPKSAGISLWVDDEPRYHFHDVEIPSPWRGDEHDIEAMLDA